MFKLPRWAGLAGAVLLLSACQDDGPPESAMEKAWLAWSGRPQVRGFEKVSCKQADETRWFCSFRTRHRLRRGRRKATLVAKRSGYYRYTDRQWSYLGK